MALSNNRAFASPTTMRPPRNVSSVVVPATAASSQDCRWSGTVGPATVAATTSQRTCPTKAPPPPPSQHMPQQYASHFPSLPDSTPSTPCPAAEGLVSSSYADYHHQPPVQAYQVNVVESSSANSTEAKPDASTRSGAAYQKDAGETLPDSLGASTALPHGHRASGTMPWAAAPRLPTPDMISVAAPAAACDGVETQQESQHGDPDPTSRQRRALKPPRRSSHNLSSEDLPIEDTQSGNRSRDDINVNDNDNDNDDDDDDDDDNDDDGERHTHTLSQVGSSLDDSVQTLRVRAVISGWKAGTIIGRQGAVINSLRQDSNCKIAMSDDPTSPDRMLSVSGHPNNVAAVLEKVCFLLSSSPRPKSDDSANPTINFTLAVPSPMCGCLIGRKGAQIREFRQRYGVAFSVSSSPIADSVDRPVSIAGYPRNVANCLREVCKFLAQSEDNSNNNASTPTSGGVFRNMWKQAVSAAGVHVHGEEQTASASTEAKASSTTAAAPAVRHRRPTNAKNGGTRRSVRDDGMSHHHHHYHHHADDGDEMLGNSIRECSFDLSNGDTEVHLLVPNDIVGCIIGRGGRTISEIRETSGAFISITDGIFPPPPPPNAVNSFTPASSQRTTTTRGTRRDRVIVIRGVSKSVRTARYLMGSSILNAQRGGASLLASVADSDL